MYGPDTLQTTLELSVTGGRADIQMATRIAHTGCRQLIVSCMALTLQTTLQLSVTGGHADKGAHLLCTRAAVECSPSV